MAAVLGVGAVMTACVPFEEIVLEEVLFFYNIC